MKQDRRVAPIVLPASLETFISQHVGHDDISEACPLALARLAARLNEVSRFEPNPQPLPNWQRVTKSGFHPSVQGIKRSRFHEGFGQAPAVLDRMEALSGFTPEPAPARFLPTKQRVSVPVSNPCGMIDEEWTPIGLIFGKRTRTRQRQPARPERNV
ncbi:MAG: hypothetical protein ACRC9K_16255 [Afipia sp.]